MEPARFPVRQLWVPRSLRHLRSGACSWSPGKSPRVKETACCFWFYFGKMKNVFFFPCIYKAWCVGAWKLFHLISNHVNRLKIQEAVSGRGSLQLSLSIYLYIVLFAKTVTRWRNFWTLTLGFWSQGQDSFPGSVAVMLNMRSLGWAGCMGVVVLWWALPSCWLFWWAPPDLFCCCLYKQYNNDCSVGNGGIFTSWWWWRSWGTQEILYGFSFLFFLHISLAKTVWNSCRRSE